ncbi:bifunctional aspartate kinase/diaminopimelate decarboxylase [Legionella spiritensis]|uniref:Diaminopimelate decarboxylase n=1 Tax=Legionella spiritensis TaxID=452 RepID=A0A0W0YX33_LEGSP|nr:bifunctional aspartate kinase/diaminopimelate decarboxylase [Legionella spiritensis]KTD61450.1 diaminopimelate decarboxylase, aspartate kinase (fusion of lysA and lysC) [Legionella spiritensis]SNV33868.1 diaminopimelate decarboxylase, aspartate kinase (fusion of lysA and lysC) [Legionella spiritensis]
MQQLITKFGGTSVSSRQTWDNIAKITRQHVEQGAQPVIVCSALAQISNKLEQAIDAALYDQHHTILKDICDNHFELADALEVSRELVNDELTRLQQLLTGIALLKEAPAKARAQIMSCGELMMTRLGHAFLRKTGIDCLWFDVRDALVSTPIPGGDGVNYLTARCDSPPNPGLRQKFLNSGAKAIITQGFFAANAQGETVLLGRGGSDTSATLLAASLEASLCEIWTDVPGIYTANPHQLPHARLLKQINYDEAQEIASMGAKVLHPNCIPPVRKAGIPMVVKYTRMPEHSGTRISKDSDDNAPPIKSIQVKHSIILISIDTLNMWQQVGFLADVFTTFKTHGFSVDLLSSSEFNVTLSLDSNGKLYERHRLDALLADLNRFGRARLIEPCSAVSLVGHHIRTVLPRLGPTLEIFEAKQIYLMSLASNDLNLTYVVDESQAEKLRQQLHHLLIESNPQSFYYSKSWHEEFGQPDIRPVPWWEKERERLLQMAQTESPCYVYHRPTLQAKADELLALKSIDKPFYAVKANPHPDILRTFYEAGLGFECVSINELQSVLQLFPDIDTQRVLFTPNFAPRHEYEFAQTTGCTITIDSLYPLQNWPELFTDRSIMLRIDSGSGAGHHKFVSTAGNESKFGIPQSDIPQAIELVKTLKINVTGLHSHSGSGILTPELWQNTALMLTELLQHFPQVQVINLGGGLGVAEKPGQQNLDLASFDSSLMAIKSRFPRLSFWLEPGRFLVSNAGIILAKVTQCKEKGKVRFIGIETGMNSLIRPALYGAYHEIINLSRLHEEKVGFAHVVGPICESGDTLGYDRPFPSTRENDVLLIANAGAYGHCMSSSYNLRPPAQEVMVYA